MYKIGVIGAGFIGRTHIRAARQVPQLKVVGYVDPYAKADHADLAGIEAFDSLDSMFAYGVDGVIVAVPDEFHVPIAKDCLSRGASVLLEKPAANSLAECVELAKSASDVDRRLLIGHQRRHHAASRLTKELVDSGRLGKLIGVSGAFALRKDDNYFVERPRSVGLTNLIHDLDVLQYYLGRITHINGVVSHQARNAREVDTMALTMEFEAGAIGSMTATDSAPSPWGWDQSTHELPSIPYNENGTTYSLMGTKGCLSVPDMRLYWHAAGEAWHQPLKSQKFDVPEENAYVNQLAHFAKVIAREVKPIVGIGEAIATQACLDAVYLSAETRARVSVTDLIAQAFARGQ